jgi:hypothetical protein
MALNKYREREASALKPGRYDLQGPRVRSWIGLSS